MRDWIVRHPLIFCAALFAVMMGALKLIVTWGISNYGLWFGMAAIAIFFIIALIIDQRDRQRDAD